MIETDNLKTMRILFRAVQSVEQIVKKDVKNYNLTVKRPLCFLYLLAFQ